MIKLEDYELQTNLYRTIGNFVCSQDQEVRKECVKMKFIVNLIDTHYNSRFFRIRRICGEYLGQISE